MKIKHGARNPKSTMICVPLKKKEKNANHKQVKFRIKIFQAVMSEPATNTVYRSRCVLPPSQQVASMGPALLWGWILVGGQSCGWVCSHGRTRCTVEESLCPATKTRQKYTKGWGVYTAKPCLMAVALPGVFSGRLWLSMDSEPDLSLT